MQYRDKRTGYPCDLPDHIEAVPEPRMKRSDRFWHALMVWLFMWGVFLLATPIADGSLARAVWWESLIGWFAIWVLSGLCIMIVVENLRALWNEREG